MIPSQPRLVTFWLRLIVRVRLVGRPIVAAAAFQGGLPKNPHRTPTVKEGILPDSALPTSGRPRNRLPNRVRRLEFEVSCPEFPSRGLRLNFSVVLRQRTAETRGLSLVITPKPSRSIFCHYLRCDQTNLFPGEYIERKTTQRAS
jgi:hypothetical protein